MEVIALEYLTETCNTRINEPKYEFYSYISDDNEKYAYDSHAKMVHLSNKLI